MNAWPNKWLDEGIGLYLLDFIIGEAYSLGVACITGILSCGYLNFNHNCTYIDMTNGDKISTLDVWFTIFGKEKSSKSNAIYTDFECIFMK